MIKYRKIIQLVFSLYLALMGVAIAQTNPHGNISWDCNQCHSEKGWDVSNLNIAFRHEETGFPLTGKHETTLCRSCHENLIFSNVEISCSGCHTDVHQGKNGSNCESCHTPSSWTEINAIIEKHAQVGFPLTGVHLTVDCEGCHQSSDEKQFSVLGTNCITCHQKVFEHTTNPSHVRAQFSKNCVECHSLGFTQWKAPGYVHPSVFVLRGAHKRADCNSCHAKTFSGLDHACISCHRVDYNQAQNPSHTAANFPLACEECHSENGWVPSHFDHSKTQFPLTGAHSNLACENCHQNGNYSNLPLDCYGCHQSDYQQTTDPNHAAAHFSTNCRECHSTTNWNQVSWDHDSQYFPIYSGAHKGTWNTCNTCHVVSNDFSVFECINCHEHSQSLMDPKHSEVRNYVYQSTACYNCHPNGKGDD